MNSDRKPQRAGHIFRKNGYSLCWGEPPWIRATDREGFFYPGIIHPQSAGLDDDGAVCRYCAVMAAEFLSKIRTRVLLG